MKNRPFIFLAAFFIAAFSIQLFSQEENELKQVPQKMEVGFQSITGKDALNYVEFLACDELEGRDTGLRGMRIACRYVASLFELWGLEPAGDKVGEKRSFHQTIPMMEVLESHGRLEVTSSGKKQVFFDGADIRLGRAGGFNGELTAPVVFVGYGISAPDLNYDDLAGLDLKGKILLVMDGVPGGDSKDSPFNDPKNSRRFSGYYRFRGVMETLREKGAVGVITIRSSSRGDDEDERFGGVSEYKQGTRIESPSRRILVPELDARGGSLTSINASEQVADALLAPAGLKLAEIRAKIDSTLKPQSMALKGVEATLSMETKLKPIISGNVIGMIEGSDPELKKEAIVIGGHLDHLGMNAQGYVFNGADDNASGSAGVMEAAQAFALNPIKPKRTIIFACWTGEEKGLYGSRYFVEFPTVDKKIIACLNMDMISRDFAPERLKVMAQRMGFPAGAATDINDESSKRLVTASMSAQSPALLEITTRLNKDYLGMVYFSHPSAQLSGGSDHAPFHQKSIPAVFFFAAMTDDYHQPGDTADKMNLEKMQNIIRLVYLTAFEIADQAETITWTEVKEN